ncbi:hypothetical protein A3860_08115 [Niastella vici]|uniref:non-specific serine/threonine protein kinase n=1 Tax=Niastella vici TaxID=1703345 RepID=A0A1V9FIS7_9BACT|nr:COR domain-containing protein [Niastella vici]OQP58274.1 hypothetical protein A3860_08115 [Niastella vici]
MSELAIKLINEAYEKRSSFLDLGNCGLREIPKEILKLKDFLERLNLSHRVYKRGNEKRSGSNIFTDNESSILLLKELTCLVSLNLNRAGIGNAGAAYLSQIATLTSLDIGYNDIKEKGAFEIGKLSSLSYLDISYNFIGEKGAFEIGKLSRLTSLDISRNAIGEKGAIEIGKLSGLTFLNISNNDIGEKGAFEIGKLSGLTSLDISDNEIGDNGAKYISQLSALVSLKIRDNEIGDIGAEYISQISTLKSLDISGNEIKEKGAEYISHLLDLNTLDLHNNKIGDKGTEYLSHLRNLTFLNLGNNVIGNYGAEYISKLTSLNSLSLSDNAIEDQGAEWISCLNSLTSLALSRNFISDKGAECISRLPLLSRLYLSNNNITKIPLFISRHLKLLQLSKNQIETLTLEFIKNTSLSIEVKTMGPLSQKVFLYGNPIKNVPREVLESGRDSILEYLEGKLRPLNECKLIFVGDGAVGKTSLMKRLVNDHFNEQEGTTHGINKIAWKEIKNELGARVKVNCWDFGGQHIQHSLHQFFFTERVVYVLVLNPRNDEKAGYWLDQIDKLGPNSQILIVYNWKDKEDTQADFLRNFRELKKTYKYLPEPIVLSCRTGEGMNDFKTALKNVVLANEGLKTKYPEPWFNIKEKLETRIPIEKHYVKYDQYEAWCAEEDYNDPEQQRNLLRILDSVGSIVFFDKPVLNELQVLNPEWISTGAYAILTADITRQKKGHLKWEDLRAIFASEKEIFSDKNIRIKYDEPQFKFILQLMLDYWLCQENPLVKHEYLIPVAFGEKPDKVYDIDGGRHYRLKFSSPFEMLIIHRFIAKNILNIVSDDYWNSGIYFKHASSSTFAMVDTNQYSQVIDCWIKGENIRGMWEVIRNDFREIFNMYHNFPVDEEVEYIDKGQTVFLKYDEMLKALSNGVAVIPYDTRTGLKDIDVLRILELFEAPNQNLKIMEKEQIKVEVNPQITINPQFTNNPVVTNTQTITEPVNKQPPAQAKSYDLHAENKKVKQWKNKAVITGAISAVFTALLVVIGIKKWLLGANAWKALEQYEGVKWIGAILALIWNGFIVKSLYDRFYDPSKEKAFREALRK